jgi:hypothetical protein
VWPDDFVKALSCLVAVQRQYGNRQRLYV